MWVKKTQSTRNPSQRKQKIKYAKKARVKKFNSYKAIYYYGDIRQIYPRHKLKNHDQQKSNTIKR